jgi:hypothetical protein
MTDKLDDGRGGGGGGGAKSYDGWKVWAFTNYSILSGDLLVIHLFPPLSSIFTCAWRSKTLRILTQ